MRLVLRSILVVLAALPLFAQSDTPPGAPTGTQSAPAPAPATAERRALRNAIELQFFNFSNFFQAPPGQRKQKVKAVGAAYRATWTPTDHSPEIYGRLAVLRYSGGASETSYTGTAGIAKYGSVHWFDVYVEHTANGYAFEVDQTRASADITTLSGHYSYGITPDWRVGTDLYADRTRFDVDDNLANDYRSLGLDVRYRGFGKIIQPRIGYVAGARDSRNRVDSADDRYWFVELRTQPTKAVDVRLRYRDRTIDYTNIDRTDDRTQWLLRASFKQNDRITWAGSFRTDDTESTNPSRTFDGNTAYVGVTYGF